ncbi:MAG TPA: alpha/beta fold hydrolase [Longimicrobiales bacterium]|nr:alpha/beta fold hydrolase [Longimicrobiales bacterium]
MIARLLRLLSAPALLFVTLWGALPTDAVAQQNRQQVQMDTSRARELYVSDDWDDHPESDYARAMEGKARTDSIYAAVTKGVVDYRKITYRSSVGDMDIPAYLFQPLEKRGPRGHAALVWVHGGVHGNWGENMWPFIREAVERGYVVICPEYRGSTGYGEAHHRAIDYGGYEVDDAMTAHDWMTGNLPHVDPERVGMMGWSHGGYITTLAVTRDGHPFKAGAAIVPVTNLIFRLSYKGPSYQRSFSTQQRIQGLPFEQREKYVERSPLYAVDHLETPLLVHVSTNDEDVNFVENQQLVYKLKALHPDLTETKIYVDPAPWGRSVGHAFSRRVDPETLERVDSPAQRDSWNRTWTFFEWYLHPYDDPNHPVDLGDGIR